MSKKKRRVGLSEVKRIDSRCTKPVGIRELMEWVIAHDLTLAMKLTPKQVQKRWSELLEMASLVRNNVVESSNNRINHSIAA